MRRLFPLLLLSLLAGPARAAGEDHAGLVQELHALHPDAARHLAAGLEAWAEDPARAEGLLSEAMTKAPGFAPLSRIGCELALENGRRSRAVHWCRQAHTQGESPDTLRALALALATPGRGMEPTPDELEEAAELAVRAALLAPQDVLAALSLCEVALYADDGPRLQTCVSQLQTLDPESMSTRYYAAHLDAARGRLWAARRALDAARSAGLDDALYEDARRTFAARRAEGLATAEGMGLLALGWLVLVLSVLGLAKAGRPDLRREIERLSGLPPEEDAPWPLSVRRHRGALRLLAGVGGSSVIVVLVVLVGAGLGLVRQLINQPLPEVEAAIAIAGAVVLLYVLFLQLALPQARRPAVDRGFPIDLTAYPALEALVDRAIAAADAAPLDRVLLVPDARLEVAGDGGGIEQLVGHPERHLWLGVGLLGTATPASLLALLVRELQRDALEDPTARLRRLLPAGIEARRGLSTAAGWNPWWRGAEAAVRAWQTASEAYGTYIGRRLDRLAARAGSPANLADGLEAAARAEAAWTLRLGRARADLLDPAAGVRNLYAAPAPRPQGGPLPAALSARIDALRAHEDRETTARTSAATAWSLLPGREGIEQEMTRLQRRLLQAASEDEPPPS